MEIDHQIHGQVLVLIPLEKRIDYSVATPFKSTIVDWINKGNRNILLDLSSVDFIDSSGLGAIVSSLKTLGKEGDLVICGLKDTVKSLFELTRMNKVFKIYPEMDEALKGMGNRVS